MGAEFLPYVQGVPFLLPLLVVAWLWRKEINRTEKVVAALIAERKDHGHTQRELDEERDARRKFEDKVDLLTREVRAATEQVIQLKAEVHRLRAQLGETA